MIGGSIPRWVRLSFVGFSFPLAAGELNAYKVSAFVNNDSPECVRPVGWARRCRRGHQLGEKPNSASLGFARFVEDDIATRRTAHALSVGRLAGRPITMGSDCTVADSA